MKAGNKIKYKGLIVLLSTMPVIVTGIITGNKKIQIDEPGEKLKAPGIEIVSLRNKISKNTESFQNQNEKFSVEYFTEKEKRNTSSSAFFLKKTWINTEHPGRSFRFIGENNLICYLERENPEEFLKLGKNGIV